MTIEAHHDSRVVMSLIEMNLNSSPGCAQDSLSILDKMYGSTLFSGCGCSAPGKVVSEGEVVEVRFVSDGEQQGCGFELFWYSVPK